MLLEVVKVEGCSEIYITLDRVSHSGGWAWAAPPPPILRFFRNPPPIKIDAPPNGAHPPLKNEAPSEKQPPPPLKREAPFHEMIIRKSTINNNLNSS